MKTSLLLLTLLSSTLLTNGQTVYNQNFTSLDATTKAAASNVTLTGTLSTTGNSDFRQLRDLAWQLETLDLSAASCPSIPNNALHSRYKLRLLRLPHDVENIGSQAFFACRSLTGTLKLPASTRNIGTAAFANCAMLQNVVFEGDEVDSIGQYAFVNCTALRGHIRLPRSLKVLRTGTFQNCTNIESIELPAELIEIQKDALAGCTNLRKIIVTGNVSAINIDQSAFEGVNPKKCVVVSTAGNSSLSKPLAKWTASNFIKKSANSFVKNNGETEINLVPMPQKMEWQKTGISSFPIRKYSIKADANLGKETHYLKQVLEERLAQKHINKKGIIQLKIDSKLTDNESYTLDITSEGITIKGKTSTGIFWGITTLEQLMVQTAESLPALHIEDTPRTHVRELMVDPSRHFIQFDDLKAIIPEMARYKLNSLHLHLADDQAWRMEIKAFPRLTEEGSHRVGMDDRQVPISGYYTQAQMRELVAYADSFHVMIVPEIEMPGHSVAAIHCYPYLTCGAEEMPIRTTCGVSNKLLCASNEQMYAFYGQVFREMADIFPTPYFHIGGDEAGNPPLGDWNNCASCNALKKEKGFEANWQLQEYMFGRMIDTLHALGKTPMFWYETDFKRIPEGCITFAWRHGLTQRAIEAAVANNAQIMLCPGEHCYLDYPEQRGDMPEVNWGMPITSLEQTYRLNPAWGNSEELERKAIFGVAGTLWSECIDTPDRLSYMAYPRALALAEAGWSAQANRSWESFLRRIQPLLRDMLRRGKSTNVGHLK